MKLHPLIKLIADERKMQGITRNALEKRAGLGHNTIQSWAANRRMGRIDNVESALDVLGYDLKAVKRNG
jgi:transcriptional regulator with XRE-family HTH domain